MPVRISLTSSIVLFWPTDQQPKTQGYLVYDHVWNRKASDNHIWEGGSRKFGIFAWLKGIKRDNCCSSISETGGKPGAKLKRFLVNISLHPLTSVYVFLSFSPGRLYMKAQPKNGDSSSLSHQEHHCWREAKHPPHPLSVSLMSMNAAPHPPCVIIDTQWSGSWFCDCDMLTEKLHILYICSTHNI